jgi:hypothetical protein
MNDRDFNELCELAFAPLSQQYGLRLMSSTKDRATRTWTVGNSTTAIKVVYEAPENYLAVLLCRLFDGQLFEYKGEIRPDTSLSCFDANDLLIIRGAQLPIGAEDNTQQRRATLLQRLVTYAQLLQAHADDIMIGNFEVFAALDAIVKQRAREAAYRKWGERAREFGW